MCTIMEFKCIFATSIADRIHQCLRSVESREKISAVVVGEGRHTERDEHRNVFASEWSQGERAANEGREGGLHTLGLFGFVFASRARGTNARSQTDRRPIFITDRVPARR